MKWYEVSVSVIKGSADDVAMIFHDFDTLGVEIIDVKDFDELPHGWLGTFKDEADRNNYPEQPIVKGYFEIGQPLDQLVQEILATLQSYEPGYNMDHIETSIVEDSEWATQWKEYYKPIHITHDLRIIPIWEKDSLTAGDKLDIFLDPGVAFGTGSHATTQLAIQLLLVAMRGGEQVIDVGTGSGILAITAAKLGASHVEAYDADEQAVDATKYNIALNNLTAEIHAAENNILNGIDTQADLIVANILAEILLPLIPQAYANLRPNGVFILSGIYKDRYEDMMAALIAGDFRIEEIIRRGDWYAIYARKGRDETCKDTL